MAQIDLRDRLISDSSYETEEGFDSKLNGWLSDAVTQHAPGQTSESLPAGEFTPVVLLAWISLCYARASKYSALGNISGSGYGTDRDSPYRKSMDMASALQKRYDRIVADYPTSDHTGNVIVSSLYRENSRTDQVSPAYAPVIRVTLTAGEKTATSAVLRWSSPANPSFSDLFVYHQVSPGIYQDWNQATDDGVPEHSNSATKIKQVQDPNQRSLKVTGLNPASDNYFVVVLKTTAGRFYYSNEVVAVTPPA